MEKKIEDYLPFYFGQKVIADETIYELVGICPSETEPGKMLVILDHPHLGQQEYYLEDCKLLLRPLSSITEQKRKELWDFIFSNSRYPFRGTEVFIDETTHYTRPRWVLSQGVERLGIEMDGHIWADSDLHYFRHNNHEVTKWLCKNGFDIFGLIDAGLAIDATK